MSWANRSVSKLSVVSEITVTFFAKLTCGEHNFQDLFLDASAGVTARHAQGFHGYIYSVRMDGVEMLAHGHMTVSKERALTSDFVTKPGKSNRCFIWWMFFVWIYAGPVK